MQKNSYIRFDWAIKRLLRDKANFSVLEGLLTVLLCEEIRIKEIIKDEKAYCVWDDAQTDRIDIKAKDKKGDDRRNHFDAVVDCVIDIFCDFCVRRKACKSGRSA